MKLEIEQKDFINACDYREETRKHISAKEYEKMAESAERGLMASDDRDISYDLLFFLEAGLVSSKVVHVGGELCEKGKFAPGLNEELGKLQREREETNVSAVSFFLSLVGVMLCIIPILYICFFLPTGAWLEAHLEDIFLGFGAICGIIGLLVGGWWGLIIVVVVLAGLGWLASTLIPFAIGVWLIKILVSALIAYIFYLIFSGGLKRNYKAFYGSSREREERYRNHGNQLRAYLQTMLDAVNELGPAITSGDESVKEWLEGKKDMEVFDEKSLKDAYETMKKYYEAALRACP